MQFTLDELKLLLATSDGPCVSLFLSTHRAGPEIRQDPIRLKNLMSEAQQQLRAQGLGVAEAAAFLAPVRGLLEDHLFWRYQKDGLAVFVAPGQFRYYRVPLSISELAVVTHRFHTKPLLSLLAGDGVFYILALSQNEIRLLQATRHEVAAVELDNIPTSLAAALQSDVLDKQLQSHTSSPSGSGQTAIFHGAGGDDSKDRILRYFRQINEGVLELLKGEQAPLVLAGVDYLLPIYREANSYPYLEGEGIIGNPESLSAADLHRKGWAIVQAHFEREQQAGASRYRNLALKQQTSCDLEEIVNAAVQGRVDILFVAVGTQRWGTYDPAASKVQIHSAMEPGDEDLLDFVTIQTLLNRGRVFAVPPERVPDQAPLAAVFRY
jgi:hypothetical protein